MSKPPELKDNGTIKQFSTGAIREGKQGKGAYHLIPTTAIEAVAHIYEDGAEKRGSRNWEKGLPLSSYYDSGLRHWMQSWEGRTDERHEAQCFPAGTIISGPICQPIEAVRLNEEIYEQDDISRVKQIFKRYYEGQMVYLRPQGSLPIMVTPEHPILVSWRSVSGNKKKKTFSEPQWVMAKDLSTHRKYGHIEGHYFLIPRLSGKFSDQSIDLSEYSFEKRAKQPDIFPLNEETCWLLGVYAAEGSSTQKRINIALGKPERDIADRIIKVVRALGYSASEQPNPETNGTEIQVASTKWSRAFSKWCGRFAENKKIPHFILFHQDLSLLQSFISGYFAGDSHFHKEKNTYIATSISITLIQQLQLALARLGFLGRISLYKDQEDRFILGRKCHCQNTYTITCGFRKSRNVHMDDQYLYIPLIDTKAKTYVGYVYNIETQNHTYLANGITVHNCLWNALGYVHTFLMIKLGLLPKELDDRPKNHYKDQSQKQDVPVDYNKTDHNFHKEHLTIDTSCGQCMEETKAAILKQKEEIAKRLEARKQEQEEQAGNITDNITDKMTDKMTDKISDKIVDDMVARKTPPSTIPLYVTGTRVKTKWLELNGTIVNGPTGMGVYDIRMDNFADTTPQRFHFSEFFVLKDKE